MKSPVKLSLWWVAIWATAAMPGVQNEGNRNATVYWDAVQKLMFVKEGVMDKNGAAYGYFNDTLIHSGWGVLEVQAGYGPKLPNVENVMFAAGYLEGYLTAQKMSIHYSNMYPQLITDPSIIGPVTDFMSKQDTWAREQVKEKKATDPLWRHVGYVLAQLDGMQAGAAEWAKRNRTKALSLFQVQFLNSMGDLLDLIPMLTGTGQTVLRSDSWTKNRQAMGHCSALIKVLPGFENVLIAHSSWFVYAATNRIYKHWDFKLNDSSTTSGKMSFSSYPGFLESLDDFYLLGSGLVMTQTTNNIFNRDLYKLVTPQSLLAWQRVRVANMMARGGEDWGRIFTKFNSGTYNNQYMILDLNKIELKRWIEPGALYVVEQIPGVVEFSDQTDILRKGYWPSYNVPFHKKIYNESGYPVMWEQYGDDFSYDLCPRAKIFRRDQNRVNDIVSLKRIMRYNNYTKDPYSEGNPCKTICCREDLQSEQPSPGGCYDTKVTDYHAAKMFLAEAINGPTVQGNLPVFSWMTFNSTLHVGLPPTYKFKFETMKPTLFKP
ncbi:phospholipase B-like 1 [Polypterus senegalus]